MPSNLLTGVSISSQSCLLAGCAASELDYRSPWRPLKLWGIALKEDSVTGTFPGVGNISLASLASDCQGFDLLGVSKARVQWRALGETEASLSAPQG